jgi:hypothetical protein
LKFFFPADKKPEKKPKTGLKLIPLLVTPNPLSGKGERSFSGVDDAQL